MRLPRHVFNMPRNDGEEEKGKPKKMVAKIRLNYLLIEYRIYTGRFIFTGLKYKKIGGITHARSYKKGN